MSMGLYFEVTRYREDDGNVFRPGEKSMRFDCAESARAWAMEAMDDGYEVDLSSQSSTPWNEIDDPLQCPVCAGYGDPCNETTEDWLTAEGNVFHDDLGYYDRPLMYLGEPTFAQRKRAQQAIGRFMEGTPTVNDVQFLYQATGTDVECGSFDDEITELTVRWELNDKNLHQALDIIRQIV